MSVLRSGIPGSSVSVSQLLMTKGSSVFSCRPELDKETFDVMWEMSKPGSETEGLFLRMDQKDYYEVQPDQDIPIEWMPNVRSPPGCRGLSPFIADYRSVSIGPNRSHRRNRSGNLLHYCQHRYSGVSTIPLGSFPGQRRYYHQELTPTYLPSSRRRSHPLQTRRARGVRWDRGSFPGRSRGQGCLPYPWTNGFDSGPMGEIRSDHQWQG